MRILVVEDEPLIAIMAEDMLVACDHVVTGVAATLEEALAAIEAGGFDAVLLDIRLGDETSIPAADKLRARGLPFLFTTGGPESIGNQYKRVPMLSKPFTLAELEAAIARL